MRRRGLKTLKFVSASTNEDGKRVTLSVNELCKNFHIAKSGFTKGKKFILTIDGTESFWYVNRNLATLTTKGFPAQLDKPETGAPEFYSVSSRVFELGN